MTFFFSFLIEAFDQTLQILDAESCPDLVQSLHRTKAKQKN